MNTKYDVAIIGGGTSGCACAYICSKLGLKTILIEKHNYLGGLMTGGLVVPVMKSAVDDLNCDYYKALVRMAKQYRAQITYKDGNDGWFNPELLKIVLFDLLTSEDISKNLDILLDTEISNANTSDNKINNIIAECNLLSLPIEATYYVDATAKGTLAKLSGCKFLKDTELKQQNSLRFILGNVNIQKFCKFVSEVDNDENITNTYRNDIDTNNELHFTTACTWDNNKIWALDKYLQKGVKVGLLADSDRAYFQIFSVAGSDNQVAFNCPRINNYPDNPLRQSFEIIEGYKAIHRLYKFVKKCFPGFENANIVNISDITGIREEGRIKSKYVFTKDDLISGKQFENAVLKADYSIDIHSDKKNSSVLQKTCAYELPIESLMSFDMDNLFVAGKLVGAEFEAHSALRVQKSCMSMGEGVAKYIYKSVVNNIKSA